MTDREKAAAILAAHAGDALGAMVALMRERDSAEARGLRRAAELAGDLAYESEHLYMPGYEAQLGDARAIALEIRDKANGMADRIEKGE